MGFALTILQRRLASSPEAIYQSIKRRKERLEKALEELRLIKEGKISDKKDLFYIFPIQYKSFNDGIPKRIDGDFHIGISDILFDIFASVFWNKITFYTIFD